MVVIVPVIVCKCNWDAKINWFKNVSVLGVGGIGGNEGQTPGLVTIFDVIDIFFIAPGAGIIGIGIRLNCAPVQ